ncbi:MAG: D-glycero-beta-D-manno-heptose-7-phosphate kinase [Bacteroidetes bacterium]|nr:D-glycero-beta-D-manno-heptose-7-phosphate kinase [Bacteroidota bacterium]
MFSKENLNQLFDAFSKLKVIVVGDIMLDAYVWGKVDRISPEAPVPIVAIQKRMNRMGGAANVALNLRSLGAEPIICSVIGDDQTGEDLLTVINNESLNSKGIIKSKDRITTTKFRIFGNKTQMLRLDEEVTYDLNGHEEKKLVDLIHNLLDTQRIDAIIFQDYNKGNLSKSVITKIIELANRFKIVTAADPKNKNFFEFKNVSLFKPNLKELQEGLGFTLDEISKENLLNLTNKLNETLKAKMVMTTLSEHGAFICEKGQDPILVPAHKRPITDVSGAGDTVIGVATLCLALQLSALQIVSLSNLAGGIVCEEVGVVPINKAKFLEEAINKLTI